MKKILLLCFFNFSLFAYVGKYMHNEDIGYGTFGSYESEKLAGGDTETTFNFGINYFMKENIELVMSIANSNYSDKVNNGTLDASTFGYSLGGFYHLRDKTMPFNFRLGGEFGSSSVYADFLDELGSEIEANTSSFTGEVYKELSILETFSITGFISCAMVSSKSILSDSFGYSMERSDKSSVLNFGVGFVFLNGLVIQPSILKPLTGGDGGSSFDISFSYIVYK